MYGDAFDLAIANTWFKKKESKIITYESRYSRS